MQTEAVASPQVPLHEVFGHVGFGSFCKDVVPFLQNQIDEINVRFGQKIGLCTAAAEQLRRDVDKLKIDMAECQRCLPAEIVPLAELVAEVGRLNELPANSGGADVCGCSDRSLFADSAGSKPGSGLACELGVLRAELRALRGCIGQGSEGAADDLSDLWERVAALAERVGGLAVAGSGMALQIAELQARVRRTPDYAGRSELAWGAGQRIAADGWVYAWRGGAGSSAVWLRIGGMQFDIGASGGLLLPVREGDAVESASGGQSGNLIFFPAR